MSGSIPDLCPLFGTCGGCELQGLSWQDYAARKMEKVRASFERFDVPLDTLRAPHLLTGPWRRRAILKATATPSGVHIGFYERKSHTVVDMSVCLVLLPEIVAFLPPLRGLLKTFLATKKRAEIAVVHTPMGLDVAIFGKDLPKLTLPFIQKLTQFATEQSLARLRFDGELIVTRQSPQVCFAGTWVEADAMGFLQASTQADTYLSERLLEVIPDTCNAALDLFCGRGLFTFTLAKRARNVRGYDTDEAALRALNKAAKGMGAVQAHARNLFNDPLEGKDLTGVQSIVLDPPRVGALNQIRALAKAALPLIVYVSCNPETFARDARELLQGPYRLRFVQPLDQFLWTPHMELMAVFDLKE